MTDINKFIAFQEIMGRLKHLKRTGWIMQNIQNSETVASHSWRMAVMALQKEKDLKKLGVNINHVIQMCLLHDVSEAIVGDIVPEHHQTTKKKITKQKKHMLEIEAVKKMATQYNFEKIKTLFVEYEDQKTLESIIVKNLDKLDMLLQAYEYSQKYPQFTRLNEFMEYNEQDITIPLFQKYLEEIKVRQNNNFNKKQATFCNTKHTIKSEGNKKI